MDKETATNTVVNGFLLSAMTVVFMVLGINANTGKQLDSLYVSNFEEAVAFTLGNIVIALATTNFQALTPGTCIALFSLALNPIVSLIRAVVKSEIKQ